MKYGNTASMGGIIRGVVRRVTREGSQFNDGEILVTEMTSPEMVPLMARAGAVVTFVGGRTCHAAIVCREMGKACVVACKGAAALKDGELVEVDTTAGIGVVRRIKG